MPLFRDVFIIVFATQYCCYGRISSQSLANSLTGLPRLCVYHPDPSQYYPCVLNYIGLHSWSLYRCPNQSTFDEQTQQCLIKVPVSDTFEQLASYPSTANVQFFRLASFILATPQPNEDPTMQQQRRLVSLPPIIDKFIDLIPKKNLRRRRQILEGSGGTFWSNGYPLMRLDHRPIEEEIHSVNAKSSVSNPSVNHHPAAVSEDELKYKKICYFTNWSQFRPGLARFEPENIDPFLCTHIVFAFGYIDNQTFLLTSIEQNDEDLYRRVNDLKRVNPKLKTLLGVGGWNMKSIVFSQMMHDHQRRQNFIFDSINYLHRYNFDGLEIDWEFPGGRGGQTDDKHYFTLFLQEFKEAATAESMVTGRPRVLIAAAVAADPNIIVNGYEIEEISNDFHGGWQNTTGLNAPLYRRFDELEGDAIMNQDFGVGFWLRSGAPAHKLVLGVPLFARSFLLARADLNTLRSPVVGNGTEGPFTRTPGFLSYFEICLLQTDPSWQRKTVPDGSESEYMFRDRDWIAYETIENVRKRAAYVVANHLGGIFVWSLDMDDFTGVFCNNGSYPHVKNSLGLLPTYMSSYL